MMSKHIMYSGDQLMMDMASLCTNSNGIVLPFTWKPPLSLPIPHFCRTAQCAVHISAGRPPSSSWPSLSSSASFLVSSSKTTVSTSRLKAEEEEEEEGEEERCEEQQEDPRIRPIFSMSTPYNDITVLEIPKNMPSEFAGSKLLLLDDSGNVHSIYKDDSKWTGLYWDQFAILPPIIPDGPIAILGLGGGTSARLLLDIWPSCKLLGWEIDLVLIDAARTYFGLAELEVPNSEGGVLEVFIDDALQPSATTDGGFAGIIVDLYANGEILPQLKQPDTWLKLKEKLKVGGRIMVNCGGICVEKSDPKSEMDDGTWTWEDGGYAKEATLKAMAQAFPQLLFRKMDGESSNFMALTGPLPELSTWAATLPAELQKGLSNWRTYSL